jgi:chromosome segregation ATPase
MATNGTEMVAEHWLEAEGFRPHPTDRPTNGKTPENGAEREAAGQWALAPLVDKIAYGLARGLVVAMKELETHIANETRKVGDSVGRRLDTLQASFQDLTGAMTEQRAINAAVQEQLTATTTSLREADARLSAEVSERIQGVANDVGTRHEQATKRLDTLSAATDALRESGMRQAGDLEALRAETRERATAISERVDTICRELGVHQEDMEAVKTSLSGVSSRVDGVVERLDRQADALRSIYSTYAQRETELEQLVDGLARLRAYSAPAPAKPL